MVGDGRTLYSMSNERHDDATADARVTTDARDRRTTATLAWISKSGVHCTLTCSYDELATRVEALWRRRIAAEAWDTSCRESIVAQVWKDGGRWKWVSE